MHFYLFLQVKTDGQKFILFDAVTTRNVKGNNSVRTKLINTGDQFKHIYSTDTKKKFTITSKANENS